jgi:thioredoxin reductase (NADPH)
LPNKKNTKLNDIKIGVIGAGVAGITAALYAGQNDIKTLIFDSKTGGGRAGGIPYIVSYPGLERLKGTDFVKRLKGQITELPTIEFHEFEPIESINLKSDKFYVKSQKDEYIFDNLVLAMGVEHKKLNINGESEFSGRGVSYCAACDGVFFKNKDTIVIGNDTHALEQALYLNELESKVTILNPTDNWNAEPRLCNTLNSSGIKIIEGSQVSEIKGERMASGIKLNGSKNNKELLEGKGSNELDAKGIFISVGFQPRIELVSNLDLELSKNDYLNVDRDYKTNIPNLYAIGDLTAPDMEIVNVCASGVAAIKDIISNYIKINNSS